MNWKLKISRNKLIVSALLLVVSIHSSFGAPLCPEMFESIQVVSNLVLELCPVESCLLIGVGRSPTPIMAYLELDQDSYVFPVPLSNFRYGVGKEKLNRKETQVLFQHFSHYLPALELVQNKSLLVIDFSQSGSSLIAATHYIYSYYSKFQPQIKVEMVALARDTWQVKGEIKNIILLPKYSELVRALFLQDFDRFSPYGTFDIRSNLANSVNEINPEYLRLKRGLLEMKNGSLPAQNDHRSQSLHFPTLVQKKSAPESLWKTFTSMRWL